MFGPRADAFVSGAMIAMSPTLIATGAPWWLCGGTIIMGIVHFLCSIFIPAQEPKP